MSSSSLTISEAANLFVISITVTTVTITAVTVTTVTITAVTQVAVNQNALSIYLVITIFFLRGGGK